MSIKTFLGLKGKFEPTRSEKNSIKGVSLIVGIAVGSIMMWLGLDILVAIFPLLGYILAIVGLIAIVLFIIKLVD